MSDGNLQGGPIFDVPIETTKPMSPFREAFLNELLGWYEQFASPPNWL